jgi:hypothetical protein
LEKNQWAFLGLREIFEQGYGLPLIWNRFSSNDESLKKSWKSTGNRPPIGFVMCCPERGGYLLLLCGPDLKLAQKRTEILKEK